MRFRKNIKTINLNDYELEILKNASLKNQVTFAEFVRNSALEKGKKLIQDEVI